jgi:hypothetical protein
VRVVAHPIEILLAGTCVDDQEIVELGQTMHDHIVNESAIGIEHGGILRLPDGKTDSIVHGDVLDGKERLGADQANVAHMAHVEDADAVANSVMLGNNAPAPARGILDRHLPPVEFDHFCPHLAMDGV